METCVFVSGRGNPGGAGDDCCGNWAEAASDDNNEHLREPSNVTGRQESRLGPNCASTEGRRLRRWAGILAVALMLCGR